MTLMFTNAMSYAANVDGYNHSFHIKHEQLEEGFDNVIAFLRKKDRKTANAINMMIAEGMHPNRFMQFLKNADFRENEHGKFVYFEDITDMIADYIVWCRHN